jgi:hypothetical protein
MWSMCTRDQIGDEISWIQNLDQDKSRNSDIAQNVELHPLAGCYMNIDRASVETMSIPSR